MCVCFRSVTSINSKSVRDRSTGSKKERKASAAARFTIYKVNKASRKKREKSSAKKERKATKTLAIVLGKLFVCAGCLGLGIKGDIVERVKIARAWHVRGRKKQLMVKARRLIPLDGGKYLMWMRRVLCPTETSSEEKKTGVHLI